MLTVVLVICGIIGFVLYKKHKESKLILYIQNHKLYSYTEKQIKMIENFTPSNIKNPHFKPDEIKKRIWCLKKFGAWNLRIITLQEFKGYISNIIYLYQTDKKQIKDLMTLESWNKMYIDAHKKWIDKCEYESVNMVMVNRFMQYHDKNNEVFEETMYEILVKNEFNKNILEQIYDIQGLVFNMISITTNVLDEIVNMNGEVSKSFEDWYIPDEY